MLPAEEKSRTRKSSSEIFSSLSLSFLRISPSSSAARAHAHARFSSRLAYSQRTQHLLRLFLLCATATMPEKRAANLALTLTLLSPSSTRARPRASQRKRVRIFLKCTFQLTHSYTLIAGLPNFSSSSYLYSLSLSLSLSLHPPPPPFLLPFASLSLCPLPLASRG